MIPTVIHAPVLSGPPAADALMANPQEFGEFNLRVAEFDAAQGAKAEDLEGFIGQMTSVRQINKSIGCNSLG